MYKVLFLALALALVACGGDSSESNPSEPETYQGGNSDYDYWLNQGNSGTALAKPCNVDGVDKCEYGTLKDARDGKVYKTITIGDQEWMAEDLNFAAHNSFCLGKDDCKGMGRLYSYGTVYDTSTTHCVFEKDCDAKPPIQGVCPSGWHVPDMQEWNELFTAVGRSSFFNVLFKDGAWGDGFKYHDAYGFGLTPSPKQSDWSSYKTFVFLGADFDHDNYIGGGYRSINKEGLSYQMGEYDIFLPLGFSVRCLKDKAGASGTTSQMVPEVDARTKAWDYLNPEIGYGSFADTRDGQTYKTVVIGSQTWMAQNLNYNTGDTLSMCFDGSEEFCDKFGRLYYKEAAMRSDICPIGWHVPSSQEMNTLLRETCYDTVARQYRYEILMAVGAWSFHVYPEKESLVTDAFGFSLMPSVNLYTLTILWRNDGSSINVREHDYNIRTSDTRGSIRCVQDEAVAPVNVAE